jgi:hypothetical protein
MNHNSYQYFDEHFHLSEEYLTHMIIQELALCDWLSL